MTSSVANLGIDGLEDVEQIGTGGSSRVYRARQVDLDRVIAVKVLNLGADTDVAKRFDRERKAMGRLSLHDGIVPVYSTGTTAHGEPYLVMPYYPNGSLQDLIETGAMEWETALRYVDVAAETIAAAHDAGVVHLDLKPANILLTKDGSPRIADFGIAKIIGAPSVGTTQGTAFTPAYSAPETFLEGTTSPASDVYGLGATLWALLVGHPPFLAPTDDANLMAVIGRVVNSAVGDLRDTTPESVCLIIEKAMAKKPADRYQTAREFSTDLKQAALEAHNGPVEPTVGGAEQFPGSPETAPPTVPTLAVPSMAVGAGPRSSLFPDEAAGLLPTAPSDFPTNIPDGRPSSTQVDESAGVFGTVPAIDVAQALPEPKPVFGQEGPEQPPMATSGRSLLEGAQEPVTVQPSARLPLAPPDSDFLDRFRLNPLVIGVVSLLLVFIGAVLLLGKKADDATETAIPPASPEVDGFDNPDGVLNSGSGGQLDNSAGNPSIDGGSGSGAADPDTPSTSTSATLPTTAATEATQTTSTEASTSSTTLGSSSPGVTSSTSTTLGSTSITTGSTSSTEEPTTSTTEPTTTSTTERTTTTATSTTTSTTESTTSTTTEPTTTSTSTTTTIEPTTTTPVRPNPPQGLSADVALNGASVVLSWRAGTGPRPDAYVISRNGTRISQVTGTSFTDRQLDTGIYSYTVAAVIDDRESAGRTATVTVGRPPEVTQLTPTVTGDVLRVSFATDQCVTYRIGVVDLSEPDNQISPATGPVRGDCADSEVRTFSIDGENEYQVNLVVQNARGDRTTRVACTGASC